MTVYVNNEPINIDNPITITGLLTQLKVEHTRGSAIAVNHKVIPKISWEMHRLFEGDKIIIIKAIQGG
ncbi:MAG: thiamine biosynthesis protein ThiS [Bacteroidetes bacterium RIFOXYA12_FULL_35_11]|nr:MAG: thiamine biosynthesis protein ThiS [Bacteroidetes bacterium GWF2_35_48]OFY73331.1 MAG: thiamine biosynthesis protein ThiS [Bacteroidetes bacterium RIFOXYA12_FULL_35_11]OFY93682.1 MAG: thiamine biosynthesis protein ThiS [Bacteroidetes bacterium RIFOXYC12_FULL_35_7]OFY95792.1 MAG: thiamine biosynthesis protein ThiS [Bacteroidetes bacterium RIFOXYB2_FULL_35_7]HBX52270.1 thiamine biosynthesis protein ThiS [Bacteroidales bacterium]